MQNDELVNGVEKQGIHFGVRVHEHFTEQIQNALQLVRCQVFALGQILCETSETVLAFRPVGGRAKVNDCVNVLNECAIQFTSRTIPRSRLKTGEKAKLVEASRWSVLRRTHLISSK